MGSQKLLYDTGVTRLSMPWRGRQGGIPNMPHKFQPIISLYIENLQEAYKNTVNYVLKKVYILNE